MFSLFDTYTGGFPLLVIGFLELIIISYVYGTTVTNILTIVKEVGGVCRPLSTLYAYTQQSLKYTQACRPTSCSLTIIPTYSSRPTCTYCHLGWYSGCKNFAADIHMMIGRDPSVFYQACWMVVSPAALLVRPL